ncbi:MAG: AraC family transcriptional regulator, partial [Bacillota bacterium]|nr:AraC family transcriptional regulator [Bacillota bacterium]
MNSLFHEPAEQLSYLKKGTLNHFPIYQGIELSFTEFSLEEISFEHSSDEHILEINYCHKGIIGWDMKNNTSVYLNPGDLEIHTLDCCASSVIHLPLSCYEGITVLIDPFHLDPVLQNIFKDWGYNPHDLISKLCPLGEPLSLSSSMLISSIFANLYDMPERYLLPYARLKVQELLFFLTTIYRQTVPKVQPFTSVQAELIQEIHDFLIQNIEKRFTIEELSKKYLLNTTSLKHIFKGIYGKPIATYLKEYRLQIAKKMLSETTKPISEISSEIGYE